MAVSWSSVWFYQSRNVFRPSYLDFLGAGGEDGGVEATGKSVGGVKAGGGEPA